jgi:hypothetical protein
MQVDLRVGSVLSIPISGPVRYVAHVIRRRRGFILVAAFEATGENVPVGPPKLVALTFDSLIKTGQWTVVGQRDPDPSIPIPVFKVPVSSENAMYLQDVDGKLRRRLAEDELSHLSNPVTYSAAAFQKAINQIASGQPLEPRFAPMVPKAEYSEQVLLGTVE